MDNNNYGIPTPENSDTTTSPNTGHTEANTAYGASDYSAPDTPAYGAGDYSAPDVPAYGAGDYSAPNTPAYGAGDYSAPNTPVYEQDCYANPNDSVYAQNVYSNPNDPVYAQNGYANPNDPVYAQNGYANPTNNPVYMQTNYGMYGSTPEAPAKKGLAIASLVLSIISCVLCCCGGQITALVGLILGIVALASSKHGGKALAITGVVISSVALIASILFTIILINDEDFQEAFYEGYNSSYSIDDDLEYDDEEEDSEEEDTEEDTQEDTEEDTEVLKKSQTDPSDRSMPLCMKASDDSCILFSEEGNFAWFLDIQDVTDNYKYGTYEVYFGQEAYDILCNGKLADYDVTAEEIDEFLSRNEGDEFYCLDNLTVLILTTDEKCQDGTVSEDPYTTPYYGFFDGEYYDAANMNSANYVSFVTIDLDEDIDITE